MPSGASLDCVDISLKVHILVYPITVWMVSTELMQQCPPKACPSMVNHSLQVQIKALSFSALMYNPRWKWSSPPTAFRSAHEICYLAGLHVHMITMLKWMSKLNGLLAWGVSEKSHDHHLQGVSRLHTSTVNCCDEPVETIDWLSLSLRWHVAYIVAASPNPQPRDDILYKDSV